MVLAAAFAGFAGTAPAQDACTQPQHAAVGGVLVQSTFDGGAEGWRIIENDPKDTPIAEGGYITGEEGKGHATWFWFAPPAYYGDRSAAYGGSLSFDQVQPHPKSQTSDSSHVYLAGGGIAIRISGLGNPGTTWTHYVVPLHECADWENAETGKRASAHEIQRVLGALEQLYIRGEYVIGEDQSSLDNVVLRAGLPAPAAPDFAFSTTLTPEPGIGTERTTFEVAVKNSSPNLNMSRVSVDVVFEPARHDPLQPQPVGTFEAVGYTCDRVAQDDPLLSAVHHADVAYGYRCDIGSLAAGASRSLFFAQDNAVAGEILYRFAASSEETGAATIEADDTGMVHENARQGSLTVIPGVIDLSVSIPPLALETRSGERQDMVLAVTNKGNARAYDPVIDIAFSGDGAPAKLRDFEIIAGLPERPEDDESFEAPPEVCAVDGSAVGCALVPASEFSDGKPYLAPGETREIALAFTPWQPGELTLTGRATGRNGLGETTSAEFEAGSASASHTYWIAANTSAYAVEDFVPGDRDKVYPGEEIAGAILVGVSGDALSGAVLHIDQPTLESAPSPVRLQHVDGCESVTIGDDGAACDLATLPHNSNTQIAIAFNAVPEDALGKTLTFAWQLVVPDHYGDMPSADLGGTLSYQVVQPFADLDIKRSTPDADVRPGDMQDLGFLVENQGPASQANVVAKLGLDVIPETTVVSNGLWSFVHDAVAYVPALDGNDWRRVPCNVTGDQASCALGTLEPGQSAEIVVTWFPRAITAGDYRYEAFVGEGEGESGDAGLLANNHVDGGGKIAGGSHTGYGGTWVGSVSVTEEVPVEYVLLAILRQHDDGLVDGELRCTDSTGGSGTELVRGVTGNDACFELRGTAYQDLHGRGARYELGRYTLCLTAGAEVEMSWRDSRFMTLKHP